MRGFPCYACLLLCRKYEAEFLSYLLRLLISSQAFCQNILHSVTLTLVQDHITGEQFKEFCSEDLCTAFLLAVVVVVAAAAVQGKHLQ